MNSATWLAWPKKTRRTRYFFLIYSKHWLHIRDKYEHFALGVSNFVVLRKYTLIYWYKHPASSRVLAFCKIVRFPCIFHHFSIMQNPFVFTTKHTTNRQSEFDWNAQFFKYFFFIFCTVFFLILFFSFLCSVSRGVCPWLGTGRGEVKMHASQKVPNRKKSSCWFKRSIWCLNFNSFYLLNFFFINVFVSTMLFFFSQDPFSFADSDNIVLLMEHKQMFVKLIQNR